MSFLDYLGFGLKIRGDQYREQQPEFVLEEYFNGKLKAWGGIQDRSGNVTTRFEADLVGAWQGNSGTLDEEFRFYDGKVQQRHWDILKGDSGHYSATAGDIIGTATGQSFGNAFRWNYVMDVPVDDTHYRLKFDDWMWALQDGAVLNRSYMKKFGIVVAELSIFLQKQD